MVSLLSSSWRVKQGAENVYFSGDNPIRRHYLISEAKSVRPPDKRQLGTVCFLGSAGSTYAASFFSFRLATTLRLATTDPYMTADRSAVLNARRNFQPMLPPY
jgi:hypothetical protein